MSETPNAAPAPAAPANETPATAAPAAPGAELAKYTPAPTAAAPAAAAAKDAMALEPKLDSEGKPVVEEMPSGDAPKGPPEKYELTLTEKSPLAASRIEEIAAEAKELGLSNEDAQKLLAREENAVIADRARELAALEVRKAAWVDEIKNDPEMGGENANKTAERAHRFVEKFASPKLKEILTTTGMGNFPEFVRLMAKGGELIAEDSITPSGGAAGGKELSHAEVLFGGKSK